MLVDRRSGKSARRRQAEHLSNHATSVSTSVTAASTGRTWPKWPPTLACRRTTSSACTPASTYRVYMLGLPPGICLHGNRRSAPGIAAASDAADARGRRQRLPSLQGRPASTRSETPGGWQLIGRTQVAPYDPAREEPFLFRPGDRVTLSLDHRAEFEEAHREMASLRVLRPGMLTTVQDLGRWGYQSAACRWRGRWTSIRIGCANRAGRQPDAAAALESDAHRSGSCSPTAISCVPSRVRSSIVTVDGSPVDAQRCFDLPDGSTLRFGARGSGRARNARGAWRHSTCRRCSAAVSTSLVSRMGAFGGRALRAGDELPVGTTRLPVRHAVRGPSVPLPRGGARVRVLMGPHDGSVRRRGHQQAARIALHDRSRVRSHGLSTRADQHCHVAAAPRSFRTRRRWARSRCRHRDSRFC